MSSDSNLPELIVMREWEKDDDVPDNPFEWFEVQLEQRFDDEFDRFLEELVGEQPDDVDPVNWNCDADALDAANADTFVNDGFIKPLEAQQVFSDIFDEIENEEYDDVESFKVSVKEICSGWFDERISFYRSRLADKEKPRYQRVLDDLNDDINSVDEGESINLETLREHRQNLLDACSEMSKAERDTVLNRAVSMVDEWNKRPLQSDLEDIHDDDADEDKSMKVKQRVKYVYKEFYNKIHDSWVDEIGESYVKMRISGDIKTLKVDPEPDSTLHQAVAYKWKDLSGNVPREANIKRVVKHIHDEICHKATIGETPQREMAAQMYRQRLDGWDNADIFKYYAGDQEDIVVDFQGVKYKESSGRFRPSDDLLPYQYDEDADNEIKPILEEMTTLSSRQIHLLAPMIPAYFVPGINKPMTHITGPSSSGKSYATKFLKLVLSPTQKGEMKPTEQGGGLNEKKDVIATCRHSKSVLIDNESKITSDMQDLMCNITTGGTFKKRKLFTDGQEVQYQLRNHFIINYISLSFMRDDFANRSLIFTLQDRVSEDEAISGPKWESLARQYYPDVQSKSFDIISDGLALDDEVVEGLEDAPGRHMVDFFEWCVRSAHIMGYDTEKYVELLTEFKESSEMKSASDNDFISQLITYVYNQDTPVEGSATELYNEFEREFEYTKGGSFPGSPSTMGKRIQNRYADRLGRGPNIGVKTRVKSGVTIYQIYHRTKHSAHVQDIVTTDEIWDAVNSEADQDGWANIEDVLEDHFEDRYDTAEEKIDKLDNAGEIIKQQGRIKTI